MPRRRDWLTNTASELHPTQDFSWRVELLSWYQQARRRFPWREDRDPYAIWVREVMLQQTVAATVEPYLRRFLAILPTLEALATADESTVLALWSGLGYYRRARLLHQAAREFLSEFGPQLPRDPAAWTARPGVGRYTLGAVLSQAFDVRLPILEANTIRLFSRWLAYPGDPRSTPGQKTLWAFAESILPETGAGTFNQALMELGSLICTPQTPQCERCPLARVCQAKAQGLVTQIPPPPARPPVVEVREVALVLMDTESVWLWQRPESERRWPGFWEFPHAESRDPSQDRAILTKLAHSCFGLSVDQLPGLLPFGTVRYGVTKFKIECVGYAGRVDGAWGRAVVGVGRWPLSGRKWELDGRPVATPPRKLWKAWQAGQQGFFAGETSSESAPEP